MEEERKIIHISHTNTKKIHFFNPLYNYYNISHTVGLTSCVKEIKDSKILSECINEPFMTYISIKDENTFITKEQDNYNEYISKPLRNVPSIDSTTNKSPLKTSNIQKISAQNVLPPLTPVPSITLLKNILYTDTVNINCPVIFLSQLRGYYYIQKPSYLQNIYQSTFIQANYAQNIGTIQRINVNIDSVPELAFVYTIDLIKIILMLFKDDIFIKNLIITFFIRVLPYISINHGIISHNEISNRLYKVNKDTISIKIEHPSLMQHISKLFSKPPPFFSSLEFANAIVSCGPIPINPIHLTEQLPERSQDAINILLKYQLITRYNDSYAIFVPTLSNIIKDIRNVRNEMRVILKKQPNNEIWYHILIKYLQKYNMSWKSSSRNYIFHIYDIIGSHSFICRYIHGRLLIRPNVPSLNRFGISNNLQAQSKNKKIKR